MTVFLERLFLQFVALYGPSVWNPQNAQYPLPCQKAESEHGRWTEIFCSHQRASKYDNQETTEQKAVEKQCLYTNTFPQKNWLRRRRLIGFWQVSGDSETYNGPSMRLPTSCKAKDQRESLKAGINLVPPCWNGFLVPSLNLPSMTFTYIHHQLRADTSLNKKCLKDRVVKPLSNIFKHVSWTHNRPQPCGLPKHNRHVPKDALHSPAHVRPVDNQATSCLGREGALKRHSVQSLFGFWCNQG